MLRVILIKLFNSFLTHCFTPSIFSNVIFLPLLKDTRKSADDVNNYRPIAITSILSKLFESYLSDFLSPYLISHCNQLGFVKHGGCNKGILALKTVLTYFNNNESPVFISSLDAKKAIDRINHYNFLTVLINRGVPKIMLCYFINGFLRYHFACSGIIYYLVLVIFPLVFYKVIFCFLNFLMSTWMIYCIN